VIAISAPTTQYSGADNNNRCSAVYGIKRALKLNAASGDAASEGKHSRRRDD